MGRAAKPSALEKAQEHLNPPATDAEQHTEIAEVQPSDDSALDANAGVREAEHDAGVARLLDIAAEAKFENGGTILGDFRDTMIQLFKDRPKAWAQLSSAEQRDVARGLEAVARELIRKIVLIVAEEDAPSIHAKLDSYSEKDGFKITLKADSNRDTAIALFEAQGANVIIVRADARQFMGQNKDAENMPDQPDLGFADDDPARDSDLAGDQPVLDQARADFAGDSLAHEEALATGVQKEDIAAGESIMAKPLTDEELEAARATPAED